MSDSPASSPASSRERRRAVRRVRDESDPPVSAPLRKRLDRIAEVAAAVFEAPIGLVTLVDEDHQWHLGKTGTDLEKTRIDHSFCIHAIRADGPTVVCDLQDDERFAENPYVKGEPHLRFYAGVPLKTADGHRLGTVCVLGTEPRSSEPSTRQLANLADLAMEILQKGRQQALRRKTRELEEKEQRLRQITETIEETFWLRTAERMLFVSPSFEEMWGRPAAPLFEDVNAYLEWVHPEDREWVEPACKRMVENNEPLDLEYRIVRPDGEVRWLRAQFNPISGPQGSVRYAGVFRDVTERQETKRRLRRSNETYQGILDAARDSIYVLDEDGTFLAANDSTAAMLGVENADLIGRPITDCIDSDRTDPAEVEAALRAAASGEEGRLEIYAERADGSTFPKDVRLQPVEYFGDDAILCVGRDMAEWKEAKREIQEAKARYETLVENFPDGGVFMFDRNLQYTLAGGLGLAQVGLSRSEIEGRTPRDLFPADVAKETEERYRQVLEGERGVYTQSFQGRDYRVQTLPVRDDAGEVVAGIAVSQDITDRNQREDQLQHRKRKLDALYDAANRLVRASDREEVGKVLTELIQNTFRYQGVSVRFAEEGELKAYHVAESTYNFMPERPDFAVDGESAVAAVYRSGETLVIEDLAAVDVDDPHDYGDLRSVVVVPVGGHGTFAVASPEPEVISEFDTHLIEVLGTYATAVLDRIEKETSLQHAKEEAEKASQLKTALLQNVSHELRTPLTSITSFSGILEEELTGHGKMQKYARLVKQGGERLMNTLEALLKLSRLEAGEEDLSLRPVRLREAARTAVESHRQRAEEKGLSITLAAPETTMHARANGEAVRQVLSHLVDNAIKFTEAGGAVSVRLRREDDRVTVEVEDTGIGIGEEVQSDIFRPFHQESEGLDRQFEGSGLGLAVTRLLVGEMNGTIEVESEKGKGSRFAVSVPAAHDG